MKVGTWQMILDLARSKGAVTPRDVRALGLAPENLNKMARLGRLVRSARGVYVHPEYDWTEHHSYVEVAKAVPSAVFCLVSALRIHEVGTHNPHHVWVSVPRHQRIPKGPTSLRVVRMSPGAYGYGIESREYEGVVVRVYSLEKTIVDCFRLRRLVGHDVAVEALQNALTKRALSIDKFLDSAKHLRAQRLVTPYLEALVS